MTTSASAALYLFVCPACGKGSNHPDDAVNGYCGSCHWWTGDPDLAAAHPDLFQQRGSQGAQDGLEEGQDALKHGAPPFSESVTTGAQPERPPWR
jgi:hypothetical protein